ncbi:MAG TPA: hypothetical protein VNU71_00095, partial [Burkholderiaceae bacterium]|nr:hypothetical protein [Burkholderiaceae bacterium]
MQADGSLRVTVPRRYCFDRAESSVKKPLAAVLERIARSQAASASKLRISTPPDAEARSATLARERALSTRDYLIGHGIAVARLHAAGVLQSDVVELVVADAPAL